MVRRYINWANVIFLGSYHLLLVILLPIYLLLFEQQGWMWGVMGIIVALCGFGITMLYHRYYSHRTYQLSKIAELPILFFGTLAVQGSVIKWSHDHRLHHRFVDTDKDPYSINKGFWYAHFIWMLSQKNKVDEKIVPDLMKSRLLRFQHRYYPLLLILTNLSVVLFFGWLFNDYFGAFVVLFLTRLFINHHTTWFINSLAHTWGVQPYSREHSAVNNFIISLLTYGEGYHNYHHTFASDYRNGVRWYQFDPTKLIILGLSKIGLARGLKRIDQTIITKKLLEEDRKLIFEKTSGLGARQRKTLETEVQERIERLSAKLTEIRILSKKYRTHKAKKAKQEARRLRIMMYDLNKSIKKDLRVWGKLCDRVLEIKPVRN